MQGKEIMKSSGKKIIYGVNLNNHFSPSFCSSTKTYFGSLDEIKTFIEGLDKQNYQETQEALQRYLEGDTQAKHYIAYNQNRLIDKTEVLAEEEIELNKTSWKFINVWHWPQYMEIDRGTIRMVLLKHGNTYLRAIKASVCGLRTTTRPDTPQKDWLELCGGFWGHPGILVVIVNDESYIVQSTLYLKEKEYQTEQEALEKFRTDPVSLDCMCEDVFGDG